MITNLFSQLLALLAMGQPVAEPPVEPVSGLCAAYVEMTEPSEVVPLDRSGRPFRFTWVERGRLAMGNNPRGFDRILPWSIVVGAPDNQLDHARVQLRDLHLHVRSKSTGEWRELPMPDKWGGGHFAHELGTGKKIGPLDFTQDGHVATLLASRDDFAHFWPLEGRRKIDPQDVGGVLVSVEARMQPEDYQAGGRYLMNAAADYWANSRGRFDNYRTNGDAGISRFKRLTDKWRGFHMTTVAPQELDRLCR